MNITALGDDSLAVVLICSNLMIKSGEDLSPLSLSDWNALSPKILNSRIKTPGAMLGATAAVLESDLGIPAQEAARLAALLDRAPATGFALESLSSEGIHIVTRLDSEYPQRLKDRLKAQAPPVLYCCGKLSLASAKAVAIVGSRAVDSAGEAFASALAALCARSKVAVVSGGAKGVDSVSMKASLDHGGNCIGVMSDSLGRKIRDPLAREAILEDRLLLLSPYHPKAGFHVANAMSRNKSIYALADYAVVVASEVEKGGTWAGATENLRKNYVPLFARSGEIVPQGNAALMINGAAALSDSDIQDPDVDLMELLSRKSKATPDAPPNPEQLTLS